MKGIGGLAIYYLPLTVGATAIGAALGVFGQLTLTWLATTF